MNIAAMSEPNTMMPATAATQKMRRRGDVEVVERVARTALADHERAGGRRGDDTETDRERALVGNGGEVDAEDQRADHQRGEHTAEVVDRVGRLVHVAGDELQGHDQRHDRERQRDEEHRAPPEVLEERARDQRAERRDAAADRRPGAIDLVRDCPDQSAVMSASVVGKAMPAESPPRTRAAASTSSVGAYAASRHAGIDSSTPPISIILRP